MNQCYERNIGAITEAEQELLQTKKAVIVGCGGLGCYSAELLTRIGIGHLTIIDGDVFSATNLNRQLFSLETNLGKTKVAAARERLLSIRSGLSVKALAISLNDENAAESLKGHDVIIDALDNVKTRLLIEKTACSLGVPLIHGAVEQWHAQISAVFPGDNTLSKLYSSNTKIADSAELDRIYDPRPSVLSFTPAFCASLQVSEAVKVLLKKENILKRKLLTVDMSSNSFDIIEL